MTPSGIEPATFRFVAQHLNHCATAVPLSILRMFIMHHIYGCEDLRSQSYTVLGVVTFILANSVLGRNVLLIVQ